MKYKTYADKLKHPLWQKKRLEIMKRVMFATRKDVLSMRIFNSDGKYIIGFNFRDDLKSISRLIKKIQRYIPDRTTQEEPFQ
jgi:hypothetical protein